MVKVGGGEYISWKYCILYTESVGFRPQIDYQHYQWLLENNCMVTVTKYICYWNVIVEI